MIINLLILRCLNIYNKNFKEIQEVLDLHSKVDGSIANVQSKIVTFLTKGKQND
jgi:hypothetical protein